MLVMQYLTEHCGNVLADALCCIDRTASFQLVQQSKHNRRIDFGERWVSSHREDVAPESLRDLRPLKWRPTSPLRGVPKVGDPSECCACRRVRCKLALLLFGGRIFVIAQEPPRRISHVTSLLKRDFRIKAEREPFLLYAGLSIVTRPKAIFEPPGLEPLGRGNEIKPLRFGQFMVFVTAIALRA